MSDVISNGFLAELRKLSEDSQNIFLLQNIKAKIPYLSESLYIEMSKGDFWSKAWLKNFQEYLTNIHKKLNQIGEKELDVFATIGAVKSDQYAEKDEEAYTEEGEEATAVVSPEEKARTFLDLRDKLIREYKEDLDVSADYLGFLNDILTSLQKITKTLSNQGYDSFDFNKKTYLARLIKEKELSNKSLSAFLIRIWSLEMNTLTDTREHIGLRENMLNLQEVRDLLNSKEQTEKSDLILFLDFLIWKHEIDTSKVGLLRFDNLPISDKKYSDLYEVTLFHKVADKLEEDIYLERISRANSIKELKKALKGSSISKELDKPDLRNIEKLGWEKGICIARFIKDFIGHSHKNDEYIGALVKYVRGEDGSDKEHDFEFRDKNILYTENFQLSFLIETYKDREPVDVSLENRIESSYDNQEQDSDYPSYFREYKLGVYYYLKARKNLDEDSKKSSNASSEAEKKLNQARKLYMEMGRFTYPCYAGHSFSCNSGVFSLSTFIRHTIETDLQHIERTLHKLLIIKDEKKYVLQFKESLREEQKQGLKRTVEILAIFSALVMFASSSIQLYSNIESLKAAIAFTLFFACALSMFGFLIYGITRLDDRKRIPWIMCGLILLIAIITGIYLFFFPDISLKVSQASIAG